MGNGFTRVVVALILVIGTVCSLFAGCGTPRRRPSNTEDCRQSCLPNSMKRYSFDGLRGDSVCECNP